MWNTGKMLDESRAATSAIFIIISVILSTIVAATMVGNLFVILAILLDKNLQTTANQLVLSLAVADLMVACLVMPLGAYNDIHNGWYLSKEVCEFWTSADVLCCTASILNLLAIALDRYWAVTNVDYIYRRTRRRVNVMIVCAWTVGAIVSLAPIFGWKDPDFANRVIQEHKCMVSQDVSYQIFATISTFYAPLVLLLALYWRIFQVARKRIRRKPGQTRGLGSNVQTGPNSIVCSGGDATGACEESMPGRLLKSIVSQCVPSDNGAGLPVANCSIRANSTEISRDRLATNGGLQLAAVDKSGGGSSSQGSICMVAQSNYNSGRLTPTGADPGANLRADGVFVATETAANELDIMEQVMVRGDKRPSDASQPAALSGPNEAQLAKRHRASSGLSGAGGLAENRPACYHESPNQRRRDLHEDSTASGSGGPNRSQANSGGSSMREVGLLCRSSDNKNNGPERQATMHGVAAALEATVNSGPQQQHRLQHDGHGRKEGWRRNKVVPIDELCSSRGPMETLASPGEGQDPAGAGADQSSASNKKLGHDKRRKPRRGLEAETQAFGSLSSSVSASSASSASSAPAPASASAKAARQSGRGAGQEQFDAGSIGGQAMLLLLSGVKMNEGVPVAAAAGRGSDCPCLSLRRRRLNASGDCQCDCQGGQLNEQHGGQAGETEVSSGCGPSLSGHHDGFTWNHLHGPKVVPEPPTASSERQINHEPSAMGPNRLHKDAATREGDGAGTGAAYLVVGAARPVCSKVRGGAAATKNYEACLKSPQRRSAPPMAEAPAPTGPLEVKVEVGAAAAAPGGLNDKSDKRKVEDTGGHGEQGCWPAAGTEPNPIERGLSNVSAALTDVLPGADINQPATLVAHLESKLAPTGGDDDDDDLSAPPAKTALQPEVRARICPSGEGIICDSDMESSLSASSSLLACLHQVDQEDGCSDDAEEDDDNDDLESSSSLSASFPPHPRGLPSGGSSTSSMPTSGRSAKMDGLPKSPGRTSGRINNLILDLIGPAASLSGANTRDGDDEAQLGAEPVLEEGPTLADVNLSTSLQPEQLDVSMLTPLQHQQHLGLVAAVAIDANPEPPANSKVKRKLQRRGPIQVQSTKEVGSGPAHPAHSGPEQRAQQQQPRQVRSSLQIRRRFRAMGQLVSFVQTSRNLNGSSSFSSNSASSLRSMVAADNPTTASCQRPLGGAAAAAAAAQEGPSGAAGESGQGAPKSARGSDAGAEISPAQQTNSSYRAGEHCQHQLATISGKMIDEKDALCGRLHQIGVQPAGVGGQKAAPPASLVAPVGGCSTAQAPQLQLDAKNPNHDNSNNRHRHQRIHKHHGHKQMELAPAGSGRSRSANMDIKREKKAAKTLAIITGVFVCCWLPFFLNAIIMPVCGPTCTPSDLVLSILLWLGYLNSLLNPIIYTIFSPDFRRAFRRLLCWHRLISFGCADTASNNAGKLVGSW